MTGKFPLGSWNYPSISERGAEEVDRWARCGMTVTQSFRFSYDSDKKERLIALLDECEKAGIKLILSVRGLEYSSFTDEDTYRQAFRRAYDDFGKHPAAFGFDVGDEPTTPVGFDACARAIRIQKEEAPELHPFANFCPWSKGYEERYLGKNIVDWAKEFAEKSHVDLLSFDCYTQMRPDPRPDSYFANLRLYHEAAKASGTELWFTGLSVGHYIYRSPSEDDLRWQLNTAAASGCRGVLWFFFYGNGYRNYRDSPIDLFNEETEVFRSMARVQKTFHLKHGELLMKLKHKSTYHIGESYGGYPLFTEGVHPLIKRIKSLYNEPGLISFFEDENGKEYCVLVNNSPFRPDGFAMRLEKRVKKAVRVENHVAEVFSSEHHHDAFYAELEDEIEVGTWFAPGQMEIFCFEE